MLLLLSMAGIPPLVGFYSKFFILQNLIFKGNLVIATIAIIFTVVSTYYYLRIIQFMYFKDPEKEINISVGLDIKAILFLNIVFIVMLSIYPNSWIAFFNSIL